MPELFWLCSPKTLPRAGASSISQASGTRTTQLPGKCPRYSARWRQNWHWEKPDRSDVSLGNEVVPRRAIVGVVDGKAEINYGRSFVAGHPKYPLTGEAPSLTEGQKGALDALNEMANKFSFKLDTQAGDLLFVNNLSIMHARAAYSDDHKCGKVRHVLRLWLTDRESWPFAPSLKYLNGADFWNAAPEEQKLYTLSEWERMPRSIRAKELGICGSHD